MEEGGLFYLHAYCSPELRAHDFPPVTGKTAKSMRIAKSFPCPLPSARRLQEIFPRTEDGAQKQNRADPGRFMNILKPKEVGTIAEWQAETKISRFISFMVGESQESEEPIKPLNEGNEEKMMNHAPSNNKPDVVTSTINISVRFAPLCSRSKLLKSRNPMKPSVRNPANVTDQEKYPLDPFKFEAQVKMKRRL